MSRSKPAFPMRSVQRLRGIADLAMEDERRGAGGDGRRRPDEAQLETGRVFTVKLVHVGDDLAVVGPGCAQFPGGDDDRQVGRGARRQVERGALGRQVEPGTRPCEEAGGMKASDVAKRPVNRIGGGILGAAQVGGGHLQPDDAIHDVQLDRHVEAELARNCTLISAVP